MTDKEIVLNARAKIALGWTQGPAARLANGAETYAQHPDAVCWDTWGAIRAAVHEALLDAPIKEHVDKVVLIIRQLDGIIPLEMGIVMWNNVPGRTQQEVLAALDKLVETIDKTL